jgi:hypothetical protein
VVVVRSILIGQADQPIEKVLLEVVPVLSMPSGHVNFLFSHQIAPGKGNKNLNGIRWEFHSKQCL